MRLAIDAAPESAAKRNACARSSVRSRASAPARMGMTMQSGHAPSVPPSLMAASPFNIWPLW